MPDFNQLHHRSLIIQNKTKTISYLIINLYKLGLLKLFIPLDQHFLLMIPFSHNHEVYQLYNQNMFFCFIICMSRSDIYPLLIYYYDSQAYTDILKGIFVTYLFLIVFIVILTAKTHNIQSSMNFCFP